MIRPHITLLLVCSLFVGRMASASNDSIPPYVWNKPCALAATSTTFLVGASPLVFPELHKYNIFVRDKVQFFRSEKLDGRRLYFDNWIQYLPAVSLPSLKLLGVPTTHTYLQQFSRIATAYLIEGLVVIPVKECGLEWRPDHRSDNSFPSGHTATSFVGAEMLRLEYSQVSPLIPIVGYGIAAFTGIMRIYNDRHWLGDVMAGSVIGIFAADLSYFLCQRYIDPLCQRLFCPNNHGSVSLVTTPALQLP